MTRVLLLLAAAFVLVVGSASAKTHTVVVTSVSLDKSTVDAGGLLTATYKVKNNLSKTSNPRTVRFFLTLDEDSKRGFQGVNVGLAKTPRIAAKDSKSLSKALAVPGDTAGGSYLVLACISGECEATDLRVTVVRPGPHPSDLAITPTSFDFGHYYGGFSPTSPPHTFTVTNTSASRAAGPVAFSFDYSDGGDVGEGYFSVDSSTCGAALVAGASCTVDVIYNGAYGHNVTAARMSAMDPNTPVGEVFSDLYGQWDCFEPGLRSAGTPRC